MNMKSLQGIFPVFKPSGITSAQLLEVIKINLRKETRSDALIKMGHGGTLDKTASGVLVVGINQGCSKLPAFLDGGKVYRTCCVFGSATDTYNKEGQTIMEKPYEHITLPDIINSFHAFKGEVLQKPPAFSALKLNGKRLSDLVREGITVDPEPRLVYCYDIKLIELTLPNLIFEVFCGRGFYIRSLVHDLGISLDSCAHVGELERIRQGPFETQNCLREEDYNVSGIQDKIFQMRKTVDDYLDEQMAEYRSLRIPKNRIKSTICDKTKDNKEEEIICMKQQSDQWYYAS